MMLDSVFLDVAVIRQDQNKDLMSLVLSASKL